MGSCAVLVASCDLRRQLYELTGAEDHTTQKIGELPENRWTQRSHAEPCSQGWKVYLTTLSDNDQRLLAATRRSRKQ